MKQTALKITTLIAIVAIAILGVAFFTKEKEPTFSRGEFKEYYMQGCATSDELVPYCNCTVNYLQNNYSQSKVESIALKHLQDDDTPEEVIKAIIHCIGELDYGQ